jgi:hypothetical protein
MASEQFTIDATLNWACAFQKGLQRTDGSGHWRPSEHCYGEGRIIDTQAVQTDPDSAVWKLNSPIRQRMVRRLNLVDQSLTLTMAAYSLTRLSALAGSRPQCGQTGRQTEK